MSTVGFDQNAQNILNSSEPQPENMCNNSTDASDNQSTSNLTTSQSSTIQDSTQSPNEDQTANNGNTSPDASDNQSTSNLTNATLPQYPAIKNSSQLPDVDQTAMCEYLALVQTEYSIERDKKESFENRSGLIMALIGALSVFVIDKIPASELRALFQATLTIGILFQFLAGVCTYLALIIAFGFSLATISTRKLENYPIETIDLAHLAESRKNAIARITLQYKGIILNHRANNEKRAARFKTSLIFSCISVCCFLIYLLSHK